MKKIYLLIMIIPSWLFSQELSLRTIPEQENTPILTFSYDGSGNQILRSIESPTHSRHSKQLPLLEVKKQEESLLRVYPNPVKEDLTIEWNSSLSGLVTQIELLPYNGIRIENIGFSTSETKVSVNMTSKQPGVYYLKIYLKDGRILHHTLIKN